MSKLNTVGDIRKLIEDLSDDFNVEMRLRRRLNNEELKFMSYPWPFETTIVDLKFDDIGYSDKDLCLSVETPNEN